MLGEFGEVIAAVAINHRGYVTLRVIPTAQRASIVSLKMSSAAELAFPPTICPVTVA